MDREASFEEIQEARNYLYNLHKFHAPSREAIELALDAILQESMKHRSKTGFQPPQQGRKTDVRGVKVGSGRGRCVCERGAHHAVHVTCLYAPHPPPP